MTDLDKEKEGWYKFCKADYLYYGDSKNNQFFVFKLEDLKAFIEDYNLQERKAADYNYKGQVKKVSLGILVPINEFS